MKKSRFTEAQIVYALRQAEQGTRVIEICPTFGEAYKMGKFTDTADPLPTIKDYKIFITYNYESE